MVTLILETDNLLLFAVLGLIATFVAILRDIQSRQRSLGSATS